MCVCFEMKSWVFLRVDSGEKEFKVQKENFERALASSVCLERVNFNERGVPLSPPVAFLLPCL